MNVICMLERNPSKWYILMREKLKQTINLLCDANDLFEVIYQKLLTWIFIPPSAAWQ